MNKTGMTHSCTAVLRYITLLGFIAVAMVACSKPKTEAEQYAELQDSFKYKAYQTLSSNSLPTILKVAKEKDNTLQADEDIARLLLSFLWSVSKKPDFAIAESHLAENTAKTAQLKFISHSTRAIGMHEKGWKGLALQETELGKKAYKNPEDQAKATNEIIATYLILGVAFIYEKDFDSALLAFRGIETQTGFAAPVHLTQAMLHIKKRKVKETKAELLLAANDPLLPSEIKTEITHFITEIEKEFGNMDSSLFLSRLIGKIAWDAIKSNSKSSIQSLAIHLDEFTQSVKNKLP